MGDNIEKYRAAFDQSAGSRMTVDGSHLDATTAHGETNGSEAQPPEQPPFDPPGDADPAWR